MESFIHTLDAPFSWAFLLKATVLLLAAELAVKLLRKQSAALRHALWALCAAALLVFPLLNVVSPVWRMAVLPAGDALAVLEHPVTVAASLRAAERAQPVSWSEPSAFEEPGISGSSEFPLGVGAQLSGFSWQWVAIWVWASGTAFILIILMSSHLRTRKMIRRASPVPPDSPLGLVFAASRDALSVGRKVDLYVGGDGTGPMACGLFCSAIVLPANARGWDAERLRSVLLHELAHVKRRDCLTQCFGQIAGAVYWVHPLAWRMVRRLRVEREQACDDMVLNAGVCPRFYGETLLSFAVRQSAVSGAPFAALAISRRSTLEGRLLALTDSGRNRCGVTGKVVFVAGATALLVAVPVASIELVEEFRPDYLNTESGAIVSEMQSGETDVLIEGSGAGVLSEAPEGVGAGEWIGPRVVEERNAIARESFRTLNMHIFEAERQLATARWRWERITEVRQEGGDLAGIPFIADDPRVSEIADDLSRLRAANDRLGERYRHNHPRMIEARQSLEEVRRRLEDRVADVIGRVESDIQRMNWERDELVRLRNRYEEEAMRLSRLMFYYDSLSQGSEDSARWSGGGLAEALPDLDDGTIVERIVFREESLEEVLGFLENLTGRSVIRPEINPEPRFTFRSQRPLTKSEAIRAIERLLNINGIIVLPVDDFLLEVVPVGPLP